MADDTADDAADSEGPDRVIDVDDVDDPMALARARATVRNLRGHEQIVGFYEGLEPIGPGVARDVDQSAGVGRRP